MKTTQINCNITLCHNSLAQQEVSSTESKHAFINQFWNCGSTNSEPGCSWTDAFWFMFWFTKTKSDLSWSPPKTWHSHLWVRVLLPPSLLTPGWSPSSASSDACSRWWIEAWLAEHVLTPSQRSNSERKKKKGHLLPFNWSHAAVVVCILHISQSTPLSSDKKAALVARRWKLFP